MAYDLVGTHPKEPFGKPFRCNTFLWHDLLIIMYACEILDRNTARLMMFSDGMQISEEMCLEMASQINIFACHMSVIDTCLDSYIDFRPYRNEPEIINARNGMVEKLKLLAMFLERCGGFSIH